MKFEITSIPLFAVFITQTVFFILKVTKVISWDWLWVLAPLWISYALIFIIGIGLILIMLICNIKERNFNKHE